MSDLFIYQTGPLGRNVVIDTSGYLVTNGDPTASGFPYAFGPLGRAICVDASGRLILSALSVNLGGGAGGSGETNTASNLGSASGIFANKSGVDLRFYGLRPGNNIQIALSGNAYTISAAAGAGEANTASNLGVGSGLFSDKNGTDLRFFSIFPGTNMEMILSTGVYVLNTLAEINTASNVGSSGVGVFSQKSGVDLQFKKLVAGNELAIDQNAQTLLLKHSPLSVLNSASGISVDLSAANKFKLVMTHNVTFTFNGPQSGSKYTFLLVQGTGNNTIVWPGNTIWRGGASPTLTAASGARDVVSMLYDDDEDLFWADYSSDFS